MRWPQYTGHGAKATPAEAEAMLRAGEGRHVTVAVVYFQGVTCTAVADFLADNFGFAISL